jgi:ribosomal protein S18 acetylase RimI-like enzyme
MEYYYLSNYDNLSFKKAFCLYFKELGIDLNPGDEIFTVMAKDAEKGLETLLVFEDQAILGFLMYQEDSLSNWFFTERIGFIREFWIREDRRKQGLGTSLLKAVLGDMKDKGIKKVLLTTDTASGFYLKNGFVKDESYSAKNKDPVFSLLLA